MPSPRKTGRDDIDEAITVMVPESVARAVRVKAAMEGTTVRAIVLQALKRAGVDVPDGALGDRRKSRG